MNNVILFIFIIILICFIYISYMYSKTPSKPKKCIVFDMDETLGSFVQLGIFIHILETHIHREITPQELNARPPTDAMGGLEFCGLMRSGFGVPEARKRRSRTADKQWAGAPRHCREGVARNLHIGG